MDVVGFAGSLRKGSFNKALLRLAAREAPEGMNVLIHDLADIPLYNMDLEQDAFPKAVTAFRDAIKAAHGILIVTPEHNRGVPGVLKNALDWATRPEADNALIGKPVGVMGATTGFLGTRFAQRDLLPFFQACQMQPYPGATVAVSRVENKTDAGEITDPNTVKLVRSYMVGFAEWLRLVQKL